jgi:hypothetical protein
MNNNMNNNINKNKEQKQRHDVPIFDPTYPPSSLISFAFGTCTPASDASRAFTTGALAAGGYIDGKPRLSTIDWIERRKKKERKMHRKISACALLKTERRTRHVGGRRIHRQKAAIANH